MNRFFFSSSEIELSEKNPDHRTNTELPNCTGTESEFGHF